MIGKREINYFVKIAEELDYSFLAIEKIRQSCSESEIYRILEYERIASIDIAFEELTAKNKKEKWM